jgi:regulator of PEP synthase PpsR (kinase-PPPase family)
MKWDGCVERKFYLHLLSNSTGETPNAMTTVALAQFDNVDVQIHSHALARPDPLAGKALVVKLCVSPDRLVQMRRNRLSSMGEARDTGYAVLEQVRDEIAASRALSNSIGWPSIEVSCHSIEENSAAVMNLLSEKKEGTERPAPPQEQGP